MNTDELVEVAPRSAKLDCESDCADHLARFVAHQRRADHLAWVFPRLLSRGRSRIDGVCLAIDNQAIETFGKVPFFATCSISEL
jgi:hypothetical protein